MTLIIARRLNIEERIYQDVMIYDNLELCASGDERKDGDMRMW